MLSMHCGDFSPSTHGFSFSANNLPSPQIRLTLNNGSQLGLDEVTRTLSGGMAFAVADYYRAALQTPSGGVPAGSDALYAYLVQREIDSLDQAVIARIIATMDPRTPAYDFGPYSTSTAPSRARVLLTQELPRIVQDINLGYLVQLCLISGPTSDARLLGATNRQVLAYAYDVSETSYILHIYDPEYSGDDNVALSFPSTHVSFTPVELTYSPGVDVAGFFYVPYSAKTPV